MIKLSRSPLRVSFFGGGTDYPDYFSRNEGMVVGTSINLYIHIIAAAMEDFCEHRFRILYSKSENVDKIEDIQHPVVRSVLLEENYNMPLNLSVMSDVPGGTGLGSSSAFTVGFINLINNLKGVNVSKYALAKAAINIEHNILKENVGVQDQIHASFGGLSRYTFHKDEFTFNPIDINSDCQRLLDDSMFLVYTGGSRRATLLLEEQLQNTREKKVEKELNHLIDLCKESKGVFEQASPEKMMVGLGKMLDEAWETKLRLSSNISNPTIDEIYSAAKKIGVYGGKLCGAGAGGFFLFLAPSHLRDKLSELFGQGNVLKISTENKGSQVIELIN